jgi:hypothetical protein
MATIAVGSLLALTFGCQSPTQPEFASCDAGLAALQGPFFNTPEEHAWAEGEIARLAEIQARHQDGILAIPGVTGMGISFDARGREFVFLVYSDARLPCARGVPARLEGVRVFLTPGGPFVPV